MNRLLTTSLRARDSGGVFTSLEDFRARVDGVNERAVESLVKSGAFDSLPGV